MSDKGTRLDALVRDSMKVEVEPREYGGVRFIGSREPLSRESCRSVTGSLPGRVCVTDGTE